MSVLPMRYLGDPMLRVEAEEIGAVDEDLRRLARDMFDTMYAEDGVGLAGPQVGVARRIVVIDPREEGVEPIALINPRIVTASEETDRAEEGCLSIPGLRELVDRYVSVTVQAKDLEGESVDMEADGLLARILQHEIDHLDGTLFLDRVSPLKRKMLLKKWEKLQAESARAGA
ncbi:MAG TPA: peptide deformylase [Longimicrobiales bacterium]|nr:peptide deformylase [Longimicrobiales bacterium]